MYDYVCLILVYEMDQRLHLQLENSGQTINHGQIVSTNVQIVKNLSNSKLEEVRLEQWSEFELLKQKSCL